MLGNLQQLNLFRIMKLPILKLQKYITIELAIRKTNL